jgi:UDPglucose 6-dehydrogenase
MPEARALYADEARVAFAESPLAATAGADALVIVTEWQEFRSPDFDLLRERLAQPVIFDGRNLYDPALMARLGFTYYGIGRGASVAVKSTS